VAEAVGKGRAQYEAITRLVGSTWGLTFARARILYTAVVRLKIAYKYQVWAAGDEGKKLSAVAILPLARLQNLCIRRITGAYKRASISALEKDADIAPLVNYMIY